MEFVDLRRLAMINGVENPTRADGEGLDRSYRELVHYSNLRDDPSIPISQLREMIPQPTVTKSEKIIGHGRFSTVYTGRLADTIVAIKEFNKLDTMTEKEIQAILREIVLMGKLQHRNILIFYGAVLEESQLVLELADYSLDSLLYKPINFSVKANLNKLALLVDIISGIYYLHFHGIVHRNLKATNILIVRTGEGQLVAKISEFGIFSNASVKSVNRHAPKNSLAAAYNAPELFLFGHDAVIYTTASDMYAFGVLANELLSESVPFVGMPEPMMIAMIFQGQRPRLHVPREGDAAQLAIMSVVGNTEQGCFGSSPESRPSAESAFDTLTALTRS